MADFQQEISNFRQHGTYAYKFDGCGNLIFNSSSVDFSQVYLSLPLLNVVYNNSKIETFYDPEFREFISNVNPSTIGLSNDTLQNQLDIINQENTDLKSQLDALILQVQDNTTAADAGSTKQVILELRKALGQGRIDSNFTDTFPYVPLKIIQ